MNNTIDDLMLDVRNRIKGDILDLVNKLGPDGTIIKITKKYPNKNQESEEDLNSENFPVDLNSEEYKHFSRQIQSLNLKNIINNLNNSSFDHKISVFSSGDELFIQSLLINIVMLIKPLFHLNTNLLNNNKDYNNKIVFFIKNYILNKFESIKFITIRKFLQDKLQPKHIKFANEYLNKKNNNFSIVAEKNLEDFSENYLDYLNKNIFLLNEILIQNLILWLNININEINNINNLYDKKITNKDIARLIENIKISLDNFANSKLSNKENGLFYHIFKNIII